MPPLRLVLAAVTACVGAILLIVAVSLVVLWPTAIEVPPDIDAGPHRVELVETRPIIPGAALPPGLALGRANNNLDATRTPNGEVFLAFRSAPHHFASSDTRIIVLRSRDELHWDLDATFHLGHDLREPRLLAVDEQVLLFVSRLGADALAFEPAGLSRAIRRPDGVWSSLEPAGPPGAIGWRARRLGDVPVLISYEGGGTAYTSVLPEMRIDLWRGIDTAAWTRWNPVETPLYRGGGGEADFAVNGRGELLGVIRVESGDDRGWGSRLCRAPGDAPTAWRCRSDARKYDSPFAFAHDGEVYVVARRHLRGDGRFDRGIGAEHGVGRVLRTLWNHASYSTSRKRCSLWRFVAAPDRDEHHLDLAFVLDLPSRGDTCFPSVIPGSAPGEWIVYDYSSPLDGRDVRWIEGQLGETRIYRHTLQFRRRF